MNKIKRINFHSMRNEEVRAFHYECLKYTKYLSSDIFSNNVAAYENVFQKYSDALKLNATENFETTKDLDIKRTDIYVACRRIALGLQQFPSQDPVIQNTTANIVEFFSKAPTIHKIAQNQTSGIIKGIVESCYALDSNALEACGFKVYLDQLKEANERFIEVSAERAAALGNRETELVKHTREELNEIFDRVCSGAEGLGASGNEDCLNFVNNINGIIERFSSVYKLRQTLKQNAKEKTEVKSENKTVVASAVKAA